MKSGLVYNNTVRYVLFIIIIFLFSAVIILFLPNEKKTDPAIVSDEEVGKTETFEECVAGGNPVMESYPRSCRTKSGRVVTEDIGNETDLADLIRVDAPRPNEKVGTPLIVRGEARGGWFFEADFPIKLLDEKGRIIAESHATAQGEWMTEEFVEFEGKLIFEKPEGSMGKLILEKSNPSGLPQHAESLIIPVSFK
jgi:hypothetical protein